MSKIFVGSRTGLQSKTLSVNKKESGKELSKLAAVIIRETARNGPASLLHLQILTNLLKRPIHVWVNQQLLGVIGRKNEKPPLHVEYKSASKRLQKNGNVGHWSLPGGRSPTHSSIADSSFPTFRRTNSCLYEVLSSQTGLDPLELRRKTARAMRLKLLGNTSSSIFPYQLADLGPGHSRNYNYYANRMLGGARYAGGSAQDAGRILDESQRGQAHPDGRSGHPRGHASHPSANGGDDSVEGYSQGGWKTAFLSRADQNLVAHYALVTSNARDLMERLNSGDSKVDSKIGRNQLDYDPLPQAREYRNGNPDGPPTEMRTVVLVGKHFLNRHSDPYADVFVLTFYPTV
ncbi:hypothetical protein QAD02_016299 [Eretmocerus hayati]|uniref:Uncharacterized protein n=1 Tax=Eretmocerus hayati TaxID=131215 RepID=A0ACC2PB28_9HYME|nr:hypothetical protein QAD02_016299 [Eretmocerus hayati]